MNPVTWFDEKSCPLISQWNEKNKNLPSSNKELSTEELLAVPGLFMIYDNHDAWEEFKLPRLTYSNDYVAHMMNEKISPRSMMICCVGCGYDGYAYPKFETAELLLQFTTQTALERFLYLISQPYAEQKKIQQRNRRQHRVETFIKQLNEYNEANDISFFDEVSRWLTNYLGKSAEFINVQKIVDVSEVALHKQLLYMYDEMKDTDPVLIDREAAMVKNNFYEMDEGHDDEHGDSITCADEDQDEDHECKAAEADDDVDDFVGDLIMHDALRVLGCFPKLERFVEPYQCSKCSSGELEEGILPNEYEARDFYEQMFLYLYRFSKSTFAF